MKQQIRDARGAAEQLQSVLASAEELIGALGDESGEAIEELRERLGGTIASVKRRMASFESMAQDASARADKYVRRNPWTAVAIGATAALLLGLIIARSDSD